MPTNNFKPDAIIDFINNNSMEDILNSIRDNNTAPEKVISKVKKSNALFRIKCEELISELEKKS